MASFLRLVRDDDRRQAAALDGADPADVWLGRIAGELDPAGAGCPALRLTAAGAGFSLIGPLLPGPPAVRGMLYGLGVWTASYLGWLPAAGLHPPATREPRGRNVTMIVAHLVWGAAMGLLATRRGDRGR